MANLRDIKTRIVSVQKMEKTTKAMKMVAAAKLRKTQKTLLKFRAYSESIDQTKRSLLAGLDKNESLFQYSPFMMENEVKKERVIVVTADRGLCGSYNFNLLKKTDAYLKDAAHLDREIVTIGSKGTDFLKRNYEIAGETAKADLEKPENIIQFIEKVKADFLDGQFQKLTLVYNHFKSMIANEVRFVSLFPIDVSVNAQNTAETDSASSIQTNFIFEPTKDEFIHGFLSQWISVQLKRIFLEAFTSENVSRMIAMESASKNCRELISSLSLQYNRLRQAAITTELLEIIGAAEAMK